MKNFEHYFDYNKVRFQYSSTNKIKEREIHNYHEILYLMDKDLELLTDSGIFYLKAGSLLFIPSGTYHLLRLNKNEFFERLVILFSDDIIKDTPLSELVDSLIILENPKEFEEIFKKLCKILSDTDSPYNKYQAYSIFNYLLTELLISPSKKVVPDKSYNLLSDVIEYINNNLSKKLTAAKLSELFNFSESTLTHRFKQDYNISLHEYIIQRRLFHAQFLIKQGFLPTKIFLECGYENYSSFYRAYQKFFGYSPSKGK